MRVEFKRELKKYIKNFNDGIFLLIGLWCFGYLAGARYFAELNIKIPYLGFPIFVGEILLAVCLILFFVQLRNHGQQLSKHWLWFIPFMIFVITKALLGYQQWGPLALRHSALFYYSLFLLLGYVAFRPHFFNDRTRPVLLIVMLCALRLPEYMRAHTFVVGMLLVILALTATHKNLKVVLVGLVFLFYNYFNLFNCSRTEFVGIVASFLLLLILLFGQIQGRIIYKICILVVLVIFMVAGVYLSRNVKNILSLVKIKSMLNSYHGCKHAMEEKMRTFNPQEIKTIRLYNNQIDRKISYNRALEEEKSDLLIKDIMKSLGWNKEAEDFSVRKYYGREVEDKIAVQRVQGQKGEKQSDNKAQEKISLQVSKMLSNNKVAIENASGDKEEPPIVSEALSVIVQQEAKETAEQRGASSRTSEDLLKSSNQLNPNNKAVEEMQLIADKDNIVSASPALSMVEAGGRNASSSVQEKIERQGDDQFKQELVQLLMKNRDEILTNIKGDIIDRLAKLYSIDEHLRENLLQGSAAARKRLTTQLEETNHLATSVERLTLLDLLVKQLKIKNDIEKRLLSDEIIWIYGRTMETALSNSLFRIFIWEDVLNDFKGDSRALLGGFDFGKPFRSKNLEILGWAAGEWGRDGWVAMHNSYFDMIYRAGIAGFLFVIFIFTMIIKLIRVFLRLNSLPGILLSVALVNWLVMANFMDIFEFPYHAIPFWSLLGMTFGYAQKLKEAKLFKEKL